MFCLCSSEHPKPEKLRARVKIFVRLWWANGDGAKWVIILAEKEKTDLSIGLPIQIFWNEVPPKKKLCKEQTLIEWATYQHFKNSI